VLDRVRAVLLTYSERTAFRILCLAAVLSILAPFNRPPVSIFSYLIFAVPLVCISSVLLGNQVFRQFIPHRARLIPRFASAHFVGALAVILVVVLLLALPFVFAKRAGVLDFAEFQNVSLMVVFASLWFFGLVTFSAIYFSRPEVLFAFIIAGESERSRAFFFAMLSDPARSLLPLLLVNGIGSIAVVWRVAWVHEGMRENRFRDTKRERRRLSAPPWWSSSTIERTRDQITRPLKRDLWSQIRHFQLSLGISESILKSAALVLVMFWLINILSRTTQGAQLWSLVLLMPGLKAVSAIKERKNSGLQLEFMLPFSRDELFARLGGALFLSQLRTWSAYALASFVLSLMPMPGVINGIPPLLPLLASLAALFPLFGVAMVGLVRREVKVIYAATFIMVILMSFVFVVASTAQLALFIIAVACGGAGSIWYSYRRWCRVDM